MTTKKFDPSVVSCTDGIIMTLFCVHIEYA
jgi:hypothetical protein